MVKTVFLVLVAFGLFTWFNQGHADLCSLPFDTGISRE